MAESHAVSVNVSMHAVAGWAAPFASSVAHMALVMKIEGDPGASIIYVVPFGASPSSP